MRETDNRGLTVSSICLSEAEHTQHEHGHRWTFSNPIIAVASRDSPLQSSARQERHMTEIVTAKPRVCCNVAQNPGKMSVRHVVRVVWKVVPVIIEE